MAHSAFSPKIVLASTSPRRYELLKQAGLTPQVFGVSVDESTAKNESPTSYIQRMVQQKMQVALKQWQEDECEHDDVVFITADTIGVLSDNMILTKPKNRDEAFFMWKQMSGKRHSVWTAVKLCRIDKEGQLIANSEILEKTDVEFITLTQEDMQDYWLTEEPQDKAGGYAIQGRAAAWVQSIYGSYTNVVGLPLAQTLTALRQLS